MNTLDAAETALIEISRMTRPKDPPYWGLSTTARRFHIVWLLEDLGNEPWTAQDLASLFGVSIRAIYRDMATVRPITLQYNGAGGGYWRRPVGRDNRAYRSK